jgi:hypothetical protein
MLATPAQPQKKSAGVRTENFLFFFFYFFLFLLFSFITSNNSTLKDILDVAMKENQILGSNKRQKVFSLLLLLCVFIYKVRHHVISNLRLSYAVQSLFFSSVF